LQKVILLSRNAGNGDGADGLKTWSHIRGPVVGMRVPHIHFEVEAKYDRLITQMFPK